MRIFKTKDFTRFARKEGMTDAQLRAAVKGAATNPDAALGGEVFKQRIARPGAGKSGGFRTIIVLRLKKRAVFVHGYAKSGADNIEPKLLRALKKLAPVYLGMTEEQIEHLIETGELTEVAHAEES